MSSFNRVLILGRLGHTPTLKSTQGGKPFCRLSLATQNPFTNAGGEKSISWHSIHVFGKEAENASRYLRKGRQVLVEGRIESKSQMKDGTKNYQTFITAKHLTFVGSGDRTPLENNENEDPSNTDLQNSMDDFDAQSRIKDMLFGGSGNISH